MYGMSSDLEAALVAGDKVQRAFACIVVRASWLAVDALMLGRPCICGRPHDPVTGCYMASARSALASERG